MSDDELTTTNWATAEIYFRDGKRVTRWSPESEEIELPVSRMEQVLRSYEGIDDDDLTAAERRQRALFQQRVSHHREHYKAIREAWDTWTGEVQFEEGMQTLEVILKRHRDELERRAERGEFEFVLIREGDRTHLAVNFALHVRESD